MKCENCNYYYHADGDFFPFPTCHCEEPEGYAPCEIEDKESEEEEE